jgi:hypothetical protein
MRARCLVLTSLLVAGGARADEPTLGAQTAAATVTPAEAWRVVAPGGARPAPVCSGGKAGSDVISFGFAAPTAIDTVQVMASAGALKASADGGVTLTAKPTKDRGWEVAVGGKPVTAITLQLEGDKRCVTAIHLWHGGKPVVPVGVPAEALATLPTALKALSAALDKCDGAAMSASLEFPFTYRNAQHQNSHGYKSAEALAKACSDWRRKAANVDMDAVAAPVPEGIFIRWSDIDLHPEGPGKLAAGVSHIKRTQFWRLAWREGKWRLAAVDY